MTPQSMRKWLVEMDISAAEGARLLRPYVAKAPRVKGAEMPHNQDGCAWNLPKR